MAIIATVETASGRNEKLYIRINRITETNHGENLPFLARGFISEAAYRSGKTFEFEQQFELLFAEYNANLALREQCYIAMKKQFTDAVDA